jgi:hypothetical protein
MHEGNGKESGHSLREDPKQGIDGKTHGDREY